ncbi:MAG: flavodoxin domain-containing protein [Spirochaetes bacterium]|nr:flavodoxin domain-containing protein [Spirochaetota bacterium]
MSTLVVFSSRHGAAKYAAERIAGKLTGDFIIADLDRKKNISPEDFETIIVGGSVYAGRIRSSVSAFVKKHEQILLSRKTGLFIVCMSPPEKVQHYFNDFFGKPLSEQCSVKSIFGGKYDFQKMNFFEKLIIKKISGFNKTVSTIDEELISEFVKKLL